MRVANQGGVASVRVVARREVAGCAHVWCAARGRLCYRPKSGENHRKHSVAYRARGNAGSANVSSRGGSLLERRAKAHHRASGRVIMPPFVA